jgi:hypothetical protein
MREVIHPQVYDAPPIEPLEPPPDEAFEAPPVEQIEAPPVEQMEARPIEEIEARSIEAFEAPAVDMAGMAGADVHDASDAPFADAFASDERAHAAPAVAEPVTQDSMREFVTADDLPLEHDAIPAAQTGEAEAIAAAPLAGAAPPSPPPPDREAEERRWQEMAEEIRMQVLQRIDLFTDTGLRDQLAQHLQPIVDRAAADLVATINQHVGVILRTYVSEAIEREIERWRREGR